MKRPATFSLYPAVLLLSAAVASAGAAAASTAGASPVQELRSPSATVLPNAQLASPQIARRVEALLKQMTLGEKIGQLVQYNDQGFSATTADGNKVLAANPETKTRVDAMQLAREGRLGSMLNVIGAEKTRAFQEAAMHSRLHIPILFGADVIHGYRTIYPVPLGLAASWDTRLVEDVSHMSATEATTAGVKWFYSPMVDISRDARWGRSTEGAGEDPYLGSAMARAYVRGYQGSDLSKPDSVAASVKHFAAYGAAEAGREYNTTDMSDIRLRQVYLPPYKAAVEAGAATMMSSFNALNGVPATANPYLMDEILRKEWGFDGFVVSDYTAVMELNNHGIALDAAAATEKALKAGVEVDMMSHFYDTQIPTLLAEHRLSMATVDEAVRRVLELGALAFLKKPFDEHELRQTLSQLGLLTEPGQASLGSRPTANTVISFHDAFRETVNVAMGGAAALIAQVLGVFVQLPVPNVNILEVGELHMALTDASSSQQLTAICQGFIGSGIAGEALLMFHDAEIADIAQLMQRQSSDYSDLEMLLDLSSVLIGACLSSIAEQIDVVFSQGHPQILGQHAAIDELIRVNHKRWKKTLAVEISYSLEGHDIRFDLLLLFTEDSIERLTHKLAYLMN